MAYYYTKNEEIVSSQVNRTFESLFTCTEKAFETWVDELCDYVTKQWDEKGLSEFEGGLYSDFLV